MHLVLALTADRVVAGPSERAHRLVRAAVAVVPGGRLWRGRFARCCSGYRARRADGPRMGSGSSTR